MIARHKEQDIKIGPLLLCMMKYLESNLTLNLLRVRKAGGGINYLMPLKSKQHTQELRDYCES